MKPITDRSTMRAEAVIENVVADLHGIDPVTVHQIADEIMRGLFSPQSVPCEFCHGKGTWPVKNHPEWKTNKACPECHGERQVSSPPLAVLMGELEQAEFAEVYSSARGDTVAWRAAEPLFRLRSGEELERATDRIADGRGPGYPVRSGEDT